MNYYHLFVKSRCPFCKEAKELLKSQKIEHVVTLLDKAPNVLDRLKEKTGHTTVPIIFEVAEGEKYNFIGGCSDLKEVFNAEEIQESTREDGKEDDSTSSNESHDSVSTNSTPTVESTDS
jgi:glutaredoxin 3